MRPTSDPLPESVSSALGLDTAAGALGDAGAGQASSEPVDPKRKSRRWESRLVKQKTLTGEVLVRKWVSDEPPTFSEARLGGGADSSQPQFCPLEGCGKAFSDAASLRKHMHTHGEKQYICQVEVRRQPAFAVSPWCVRALSRRPSHPPPPHPHRPTSCPGVRQAVS